MLSTSSAIHVSILFACLVIFLPLMLAGIHLSRHKLLFSSAALFFCLFIFIHVSPYLPSIISPSSPSNGSCITFQDSSYSFTCNNNLKKVSTSNALDLLNGSSILVAGDSQARLFALSLLDLLIVDESIMGQVRTDLFRRHSDYLIQLPSHAVAVNFLWAPYEVNITESLNNLKNSKKYPDVLVAGSGLWHMLHVNNASDYGLKLGEVRDFVEREGFFRNLFWLGLPELVYEVLNTEEKRMRMTANVCKLYEREVEKSGVLRRDGGEFMLLDVGYLSRECGVKCSQDGMHYEKVVYDVAVQIMVNALLI